MIYAVRSFASHWAWQRRRRRMLQANASGRPFTYRHALLGKFVYHPLDDLSRHVLLYDFETPEIQWAIAQAAAGGILIDVGANIGVFTVACARAAGDRGRVIAVEPSPATYEKLRITCDRLQLANVRLLRAAAAEENGRRQFVAGVDVLRQHLADARRTRGDRLIEVDALTLDTICGADTGAVRLVKVDVEGHEVDVLRGAGRILHNGRAALVVEVFPDALRAAGSSPDALRELLSGTHVCVAVITQDGRTLPGAAPWILDGVHEKLDTCWVPRAGPGAFA